jgi:hypothetical protein
MRTLQVLSAGILIIGSMFAQNVVQNPTATQTIIQPSGTNFGVQGNTLLQQLNSIVFPDQFAGATADAKIKAAIAACPSTGCYIEACGLKGAQQFSANPFAGTNIPITLHTCQATYSFDPSQFALDVPSNFRWIADETILTGSVNNGGAICWPNTDLPTGLVTTRLYQTTGSISSGQSSLSLSSIPTGTQVGSLVAILGAAGPYNGTGNIGKQSTTTTGAISATDTVVTVASTAGFQLGTSPSNSSPDAQSYLQIDNEIMSFANPTSTQFTGLQRGLFGTTAASHAQNAVVYAVGAMVSEIKSITGNTITLYDNASQTVSSAVVFIGSSNIQLSGTLTLDGNYTNRGSAGPNCSAIMGVAANLTAVLVVDPSVVFRNFQHGGFFGSAVQRSFISGSYQRIGRPSIGLGSDIWLFGDAKFNQVVSVSHEDGNIMLFIDDRSSNLDFLNGPSLNNTALLGPPVGASIYYTGVDIEGGSDNNVVRAGRIKGSLTGVLITSSGQWTTDPTTSGNFVEGTQIDSVQISGTSTNNIVTAPSITGNISAVSTNLVLHIDANGNFAAGAGALAGNSYSWGMLRSAGNTGFPDIYGDGTHALVIGGKQDGSGQVLFGSTTAVTVPGNLDVQGTLTKSAGSFKIDHPLDPANKYLYHSFVESPDMKDIYDGVVVLNAQGEAEVQLPDWFEALNRDFRYQLTPIGGPSQLYVAQKIQQNHFRIAGGTPGLEVSWQVTGIRHDAYANEKRVPVEEQKEPKARGTYLHPELFRD